MKLIELLGVIAGIVGSFSVANGAFMVGYPLFTLSSVFLLFTAYKQLNKNLMMLQFVFLCANINGLINFWG